MSPKPRVLFVNLEANIAGAEKSLLLLLRYLRKYYSLTVACPPQGPLAREISTLDIPIYTLARPVKSSYYTIGGLGLSSP